MAEEEAEEQDPIEDPDEAELEASEVVTDDKGNKTVSLSTMLRYKREAKASAKRIKELEPIAGRVTEMEGKLEQASPIINAILTNPKLKAEALRSAQGTRASGEATEQPEDDDEATAFAENVFGFYLQDGVTPDTARARRAMDLMDRRHGRQTDAKVGKIAGVVAGDRAAINEREIYAATDDDGTPLATPESIKETLTLLDGDRRLLADPRVKQLVLIQAAGLDRLRGRTPKAQDEPVYLSGAGSGRGRRSEAIDADMKGFLERHGISEKDYQRSTKNLEEGVMNRKGIALGRGGK